CRLDILYLPNRIAVMSRNILNIGSLIEVSAFGGERLERRVVEVCGETVYIFRDDEWETAKLEHRESQTIGFNRRFVIRVLETTKK
ncbi:MAG: hypothetical protein LAO30_10100, partial [Acidobacteriia bacterium]|nr:hypothetical protein [Terriglobia bacterium]